MALQGTIRDFGLGDIFQLIGMQRKTGILSLNNAQESVTVHFFEGQVAGASTRMRNLEDLLGGVLVRTGRITEDQLKVALATQKKTLQRLGYILVKSGAVSETDLKEALRTQVTQIIYRLFRWRDGDYRFTPVENLEYDREHFVPVSAETILMEGARMVDEWPIIERKIRSAQMVFEKTPAAVALEAPVESLVNTDIDFQRSEDEAAEGEIKVSPEEREILRMVDGRATVATIVERSPLGEFDVYRLLYELLNRHLIAEVDRGLAVDAVRVGGRLGRLSRRLVALALGLLAVGAVASYSHNPVNPWRGALQGKERARLETFASRGRLERLEHALQVFYLDLGAVPDRLERLSQNRYLRDRDLLDPWDRPYGYQISGGGYRLFGLDAEGRATEELTLEHRFSSSQRLMLDGALSSPSTPRSERP